MKSAEFKTAEDVFKFGAHHLSVRDVDEHFGDEPFDFAPHFKKGVDSVVQKKHLPSPLRFPPDCLRYAFVAVRLDRRFDRLPVLRRRREQAHIADFQQTHVERARDRRRRKRKAVDIRFHLFEFFFVLYAEALLFVDYHEAEIFKNDVLLNDAVRADKNVDIARCEES